MLDEKVGCNTVEYTTAFLFSDWLYFLWHGIKRDIHIAVRATILPSHKHFALVNTLSLGA